MNGKDAIIQKIMSDAHEKAKAIEDKAVYDDAMSKRATSEWQADYLKKQKETLKKDCADVIERRITLAELDKRKLLLKTKQDIISEVIANALKKLRGMSKKQYLTLVVDLIEKNADDGDVIMLSKDGVLSAKDFEKEKVVADKKLCFSKKTGDFVGGVMLIGKICDKDLSFKALLDERKEVLTAMITSELGL